MPKSNKLYILLAEGTNQYKIGFTKGEVRDRIKGLQTANPNKIIPIFTFESEFATQIEKTIHRAKALESISGEWFELKKEDIPDIISTIEKTHKNLMYLKEHSI